MQGYYQRHLFFCLNQREGNARPCCAAAGSASVRDYAKQRIKSLGLAGAGGVRVNTAGCLGRCDEGPVLVIYPEAVWYTYHSTDDVDEILDRHVLRGEIVERLRLPEPTMVRDGLIGISPDGVDKSTAG